MALTFAHVHRLTSAEKLQRLSALLQSRPIETLIANARTEYRGRDTRAIKGNNTYVTSLSVHYGKYPLDELRLLPYFQRVLLRGLFRILRVSMPLQQLDALWLLDNQPFSTPLFPIETSPSLPRLGEARRGMLAPAPPGIISLPSRLVWLRSPHTKWTRDNRRDEKHETNSPGEWRPLKPVEFERAAELYGQLYLQKYSTLNPAFTAHFLRILQTQDIVDFQGLFMAGQLVGVIGFYVVDDWLTSTVLGYDCTLSPRLGLYRRLCHRLLMICEENFLSQHLSAGAGMFKQLRGARPQIEWIWVQPTHEKWRFNFLRQIALQSLSMAQKRGL